MTNEKKAPAYSEAHRAYLRALRRKDHFVTAMLVFIIAICLALWELAAPGWAGSTLYWELSLSAMGCHPPGYIKPASFGGISALPYWKPW